jgi:hypothetical protein
VNSRIKTSIKGPKLPSFNWTTIDPEVFRGPNLSFPIKTTLIIAPSFNLTVLGAMTSFQKYFKGSNILDADNEGFPVKIRDQVIDADTEEATVLTENDLAIRMNFICKYERIVVLSLGLSNEPQVWH